MIDSMRSSIRMTVKDETSDTLPPIIPKIPQGYNLHGAATKNVSERAKIDI